MAAAAVESKRLTVSELEWDGAPEGRWELIDGELVEMTPSGPRPSQIGMRFGAALTVHADEGARRAVFGADGGFVVLAEQGREIVRVPDVAFVRAEQLPPPDDMGYYRLAPDLVVEVNSASDRASDVLAKAVMWLDAGVRLVWVADPPTRTVTVYTPDSVARLLRDDQILDGGEVLPDFRVSLGDLFA